MCTDRIYNWEIMNEQVIAMIYQYMIKIFYIGEDPVRGVTRTGWALKRATRLDLPVVNRFWPSTVSGTSRPCLSLVPTSSQTSSPPLPAMLNRRRYVKMPSSKNADFPPSLWRHKCFALCGSKLRSSLNGQHLNFFVTTSRWTVKRQLELPI